MAILNFILIIALVIWIYRTNKQQRESIRFLFALHNTLKLSLQKKEIIKESEFKDAAKIYTGKKPPALSDLMQSYK